MRVEDSQLGFAISSGVLGSEEVSGLARALDDVTLRSRAGVRHLMSQPAVHALATDVRLVALAERWIGPDAKPYRATLFDKSKSSNWLVVWHQDTALPLRLHRDVPGWGPWSTKRGVPYAHAPAAALNGVVALRVHLDDSGLDNGPLRVLPGSHQLGVLSGDAIHELTLRVSAHECVVGRGGVIAMRPLLVHASSKSVSDAPRRVLHIEYAGSFHLGHELELDVA
jgi:hypothetical protein